MPYIYKSGLQFGTGNITINQTTPIREMTEAQYDALPTSEKLNDTIYLLKDATADKLIVDDPAPIGAIIAYGGTTAPAGWLFCQGQAVSRTLYNELFEAIGTTYGAGDGNTTFNLPDLQGRIAVGVGNNETTGATNHTLGQKSGEETHLLNTNELPNHAHQGLYWLSPDNPAYNVTLNSGTYAYKLTWTGMGNSTTAGAGANEKNLFTGTTGSSQAHNNMQPYIVTNYIIKAKNNSTASTSVLSMIDFFYPVGSYYETSDISFNPNNTFGGTWSIEASESNAILTKDTSMSASATGTYNTGTMITLQPNTRYILFGYGALGVGDNRQTFSTFYISSGTATTVKSFATQPYAGAGNGHNFQALVQTGSNSVGIGVSTYHYDTGYTKTWSIAAIPIPQYAANCYRWHRTA